jgi:hypothetical protein
MPRGRLFAIACGALMGLLVAILVILVIVRFIF